MNHKEYKVIPIEGRCKTILQWFFFLAFSDNNTWCKLLNTSRVQRKAAAAERVRLHFHWYVRKYFDIPKGSVYNVTTIGERASFNAEKPTSSIARYPDFVLLVKPKEESEND